MFERASDYPYCDVKRIRLDGKLLPERGAAGHRVPRAKDVAFLFEAWIERAYTVNQWAIDTVIGKAPYSVPVRIGDELKGSGGYAYGVDDVLDNIDGLRSSSSLNRVWTNYVDFEKGAAKAVYAGQTEAMRSRLPDLGTVRKKYGGRSSAIPFPYPVASMRDAFYLVRKMDAVMTDIATFPEVSSAMYRITDGAGTRTETYGKMISSSGYQGLLFRDGSAERTECVGVGGDGSFNASLIRADNAADVKLIVLTRSSVRNEETAEYDNRYEVDLIDAEKTGAAGDGSLMAKANTAQLALVGGLLPRTEGATVGILYCGALVRYALRTDLSGVPFSHVPDGHVDI